MINIMLRPFHHNGKTNNKGVRTQCIKHKADVTIPKVSEFFKTNFIIKVANKQF